jgi:hypothetical protein
MPVCVERVEDTSHGPVFSIAHYYEQEGDIVPDPDVTLLRAADGEFYPLSYQDGRVYRRSAELGTDGRVDGPRHADPRAVRRWLDEERQVPAGAVTMSRKCARSLRTSA